MTRINDLAGRTLGDYRLERKLTSGGMAEIYIGEDEKLGRKAAIKILTSDMAGDDDTLRERFEREARAIANLEHDNIVPIYQFGEEDNLYFLAMRYIEGNDLSDEMKRYKQNERYMPIERALYILEQVAAALDHAHLKGIIHRDVKPSNVLLGASDKAVLSDFGLVLWESMDKTFGTAFGTPRYISPEQATDSQSAVPQSDIYSLAVIVYEIVTNQVVFEGNTPMEVALSHITETPTPPRAHNPKIPAAAQNEIMKALQKDANKRHSSATEFVRSLKMAYDIHDSTASRPEGLSFDTGTIPMRPNDDDASSAEQIFNSWGDGDASDTRNKTIMDAPGDSAESLDMRLAGGVALAVILLGVIGFLVLGSGRDSAPADATTQAGGEVVAPTPDEAYLQVRYTDNFFALINPLDENALDISGVEVRGASADEVGETFGESLAPGECMLIALSTSASAPDDWGCGTPVQTINRTTGIFWRADDASDTQFTVRQDGRNLQQCETVGRAVGRVGEQSCDVLWERFTS